MSLDDLLMEHQQRTNATHDALVVLDRVYTDAWSFFLCVFFPFGPQPPMYGLYSIYIVRALRIICGVVDGVGVASELI